jgi:hypothetical protein
VEVEVLIFSIEAASLGKTSTVALLLWQTIEHVVGVRAVRLLWSVATTPCPAPYTMGAATWGETSMRLLSRSPVVISCEEEVVLCEAMRMIADNSYSWQQI